MTLTYNLRRTTYNMDKFRFLKWDIYNDAKELFSLIIKIVNKLPKQYRFELGSQIIRSAFSILLNIAEGSGKTSDKELNRFIDIALGSIYETLAGLDVFKYNGFITEEEFIKLADKLSSISNRLGGFKKKLVVSR
ncbi:MAG: 23S ribosomal protein [Candidatus Wolfebacteria bacterium GW2011_GWC1_43_10]|uniref:23S ribosomal protein n=1 Tax=Candidatus Wolfebacteria bacterium GW2011_GWC1_43_10 TaxID=1619011 RepID=A0A0G1CAZ9_9BACT|nr:MAG: 23S ribosomal protein [Candidatus Wolfebacteria bacterium GW2011_GWC1_43_10]